MPYIVRTIVRDARVLTAAFSDWEEVQKRAQQANPAAIDSGLTCSALNFRLDGNAARSSDRYCRRWKVCRRREPPDRTGETGTRRVSTPLPPRKSTKPRRNSLG